MPPTPAVPAHSPLPPAENDGPQAARRRVIARLRELMAALDRRVPRTELASELPIARDAARLRAQAVDQIAELERSDRRTLVAVRPL